MAPVILVKTEGNIIIKNRPNHYKIKCIIIIYFIKNE